MSLESCNDSFDNTDKLYSTAKIMMQPPVALAKIQASIFTLSFTDLIQMLIHIKLFISCPMSKQ